MPLLACFPVCMTLSVIALIGLVMLVFGLGNRLPDDDQPAAPIAAPDPDRKMGPPPWWVFPLMLLAVVLVMLVLGWYWPE